MKTSLLLCSLLLTSSIASSIEIEVERPILFPEGPEYLGRWIGDSEIVHGHTFEITAAYVDLNSEICGKYPYRLLEPIASDQLNDYVALEVFAPERCRANGERLIYLIRISRGAARIHLSLCPTYQSLAYLIAKSGLSNCAREFHYQRGLNVDD